MTARLELGPGSRSYTEPSVDLDSYIAQHRPEWESLEGAVSRSYRGTLSGADTTELIRLYLRVSSHLAEVQSRYHDPAVVEYLNGLVARAHGTIYGTETRTLRAALALFGGRYRQALHRTATHVLVIAVLLLGTGVATGAWVAISPEARAGVLPPAAREAVESADGSSSLADIDGAEVSTYIFQNNVRVGFLAFALGITLGIGTVIVVVQNAVLIGLLAGASHAAGKADIFWSLVLPHGFLEIMAICIAGGAGLRIGWALIDPGDRPRQTALQEEATDAVLVVIGVIPAFGIAALIEGFVTGRTGIPLLEIALGAAVALGYLAFLFGRWPRVRAVRAP
jgi:uncharacterized membrane protein SpoIIM required for sporulation